MNYQQTLDFAERPALFYFDPPYKPLSKTSSFNSYSKDDFNDDEQDLSDESRDKVQDLKSFTFDGEEYQALMKRILNSLNSDVVINL